MSVPPRIAAPEDPDAALVKRAKTGEQAAFRQLMTKYQHRVYRLALRTCGSAHDAEDIVQEAFLKVFRRLQSFRGDASFSTWLYRVATNTALMHLRSERRRPTQSLTACLPRFTRDGRHRRIDVDYAAASRIERMIERRQLSRLMLDALDRMPRRYRMAVVLHDLEELPTAEVAALLKITSAAVRQRLHRGRLMLRGYLGSFAGEER